MTRDGACLPCGLWTVDCHGRQCVGTAPFSGRVGSAGAGKLGFGNEAPQFQQQTVTRFKTACPCCTGISLSNSVKLYKEIGETLKLGFPRGM